MKQIEASIFSTRFAWATFMAMLLAVLIPRFSTAQDYSASIKASANVAIPFGVGETDEYPESFLLAPELSTAYVLFQDHDDELAMTLRANEAGLVEFDLETMRLSFIDSDNRIIGSTDEIPLLTIILTEN